MKQIDEGNCPLGRNLGAPMGCLGQVSRRWRLGEPNRWWRRCWDVVPFCGVNHYLRAGIHFGSIFIVLQEQGNQCWKLVNMIQQRHCCAGKLAVEEFNLYFRAMAWQVATRVPTKAATVPTNGTNNTRWKDLEWRHSKDQIVAPMSS